LRYPIDMTPAASTLPNRKDPVGPPPGELIDVPALTAELTALAGDLAASHGNSESALRTAVAQRLKAVLATGLARAETLLLADRHGRRCAERICRMQDAIIRVLYEFVQKHLYPSQNPSEGEHMAIVATG